MAGGVLPGADPNRERRSADRGPGAAVAQDRDVPRSRAAYRQAQLLLQSHEGLLLPAQRDLGEMPEGEQGQTASARQPAGGHQAEEVLQRTQSTILRAGGRGSRLA